MSIMPFRFGEKASARTSRRDALARRLICGLALVALVVFAPVANADIKTLREDGKVTWGTDNVPEIIYLLGGEVCTEADPYDELVLKFTSTNAPGTLTIASGVKVSARTLVVGGGGAGGTSTSATAGAGGGGGAGGFIDQTQTIEAGTYTITVGAGGSAATSTDAVTPGESGNDSSFVGGTVSLVAKGGGGGGAQSAGNPGGSGGGGSRASANCIGGDATPAGQGNAGGKGTKPEYGAGGGGAGGAGGNTSSSTGPGIGGIGKASDIILNASGVAIYYAGGGAGGSMSPDFSTLPSKGGGGAGGTFYDDAKPGDDGLGGGGGGGGSTAPGGKGGDGVVILRIRDMIITPPKSVSLEWNNENQIGYEPKNYYEIVDVAGDATNAVNAGTYRYHIKPAEDFEWATWEDSNKETKTIEWEITPMQVDIPTSVTVTYDGASHEVASSDEICEIVDGVAAATNAGEYSFTMRLKDTDNTVWSDGSITNMTTKWSIVAKQVEKPAEVTDLVYSGTNSIAFTEYDGVKYVSGTTNSVNAGSFEYKVALDNPAGYTNYVWAGESGDASVENKTVPWSVAPQTVEVPKAKTDLVYTNEPQNGFASLDWSLYELASGTTNETAGGTHQATFHLTGNGEAVNYVWSDPPGSSSDRTVSWTIAAAANEITHLALTGWRIGTEPNDPDIRATWGTNTVQYSYGRGESEESVTDWIASPYYVAEPGTWVLKAVIPEDANWAAATGTTTFVMWNDPEMLYHDWTEITIKARAGATETLVGFPVPVRISETRMPGFKYEREGGHNGEEMVFVDKSGNLLPYEVDTWNTSGESVVWVRLEELPPSGTTIMMFWNLREGMSAIEYTPDDVWDDDYVGIWHMPASGTTVKDSKKINNGTMTDTAAASADGKIGAAASLPQSGAYINCGTSLANSELVSGFTVEGWANSANYAGTTQSRHYLFGKNNFIMLRTDSQTQIRVTTPNINDYTLVTVSLPSTGSWFHYALSFDTGVDDGVRLYINGELVDSQTAVTKDGKYFADSTSAGTMLIGTSQSNQDGQNFWGLLDEYRLSKTIRSAEWLAAEYASVADDGFTTNSIVQQDGLNVDYWVVEPSLKYPDMLSWDIDPKKNADAAGNIRTNEIETVGELLYGEVTNYIYSVYDTNKVYRSISEITEGGEYCAVFARIPTDDFQPLGTNIKFRITKSKPYTKIGGTNGNSGRILLMNDHNAQACKVQNQGYDINTKSFGTFWQRIKKEEFSTSFNLKPETESILWTKNFGAKLWHILNCRHGNTYASDSTNQNFLPYSPASDAFDNTGMEDATAATAGQVVMRNMVGAAVYSPCYTNGIGTIYFDAVNGWAGINDYNNIVVEVATRTVDGLPPTDENCMVLTTNVVAGVEVVDTNWYGKLDETCWTRYPMHPFVITNGVGFVETNTTTELSLQMNIGGRADSFYRVVVPVDYTGAVRFRILRTTCDSGKDVDKAELILLDNIIASPPAMGASLESHGLYDGDKTGKQLLGWELASSVAFPSVEDTEVFGRAKVKYYVNSGDGATSWNTNDFFNSATMFWRWRYLNQTNSTWQAIELNPSDGFKAMSAFDLPGQVCDVEYWYEYTLQAPYYSYVDYSGVGKPIAYTEERGTVTNAYNSAATLPSGGTNWFFRVREGKSQYEKMVLTVDDSSLGAEIPQCEYVDMDLVGSHQWRGFVTVTNKAERALSFYITGVHPQVDGTTEFDDNDGHNENFYAGIEYIDITERPFSGEMKGGSVARIHYLTNVASYIEFQFNDETKAISISHADYQDFNTWFSSRYEDDAKLKFYSSAHETNSTTLATTRYPAEATNKVISAFAETPRTADAWHEEFKLTGAQTLAGYPMNEPFLTGKARTPKGWLAENGMWVAQKWGMTNSTDFAYQMEGCGQGSVTFNITPVPNGLDTIEFTPRLAQFNEFKNVSFSWEQIMQKNYTIAAQACFDTDPQFKNFSGEASVSLFAGYVPYTGGYEYRITIYNVDEKWKTGTKEYQRACVRHAIYKWHVDGSKLVDKLLVEVLDNEDESGWSWNAANSSMAELVKKIPLGLNGTQYSGMYMSFSNANNSVYITAGVSDNGEYKESNVTKTDKENANVDFTYSGKQFQQIGCEDSSPVTTFGTYGALIKNCPGRVLYPRIYKGQTVDIPGSGTTTITGGKRWKGPVELLKKTPGNTPSEVISENGKIGTCWAKDPGRMVELSGDPWGLAADTNITQKIGVYTLPVGSTNNWTCLTNLEVSTFNNEKHVINLQTREKCQVMFKSSAPPDDIRTDIVIDDIMLAQWCGQSGTSTNPVTSSYGYADDFYYTGSWISNRVEIVDKKPTTNHVALLAPRRAELPNSPIGIRSPYMKGLGAIIFDYCDADEGAELVLQKWTGSEGNLSGHTTDPADKSDWTTLTNWTFTAGESGTKSYYYGLRTPSNGVFRLVIPQSKVREAYAHGEYDPNWRAITIKDVYCYDEPAFDTHSWWGWNFLTTGWNDGKGNKYAAIDDSKEGAVGVLNNTLAADTLKDGTPEDYSMNDPFIQSPTFGGDRSIGEIAFRARRYDDSSSSYITVWGAKSGDMQKGLSWTAITNVPVDSVSYKRYIVKCAAEEGYAAIRLGVAKVQGVMPDYTMTPAAAAALPESPVRMIVDEVVIRERVKPEVGFKFDFVRPFRLGLSERTAVPNIDSRDQQPLLGEQFGFQAEVEVTGLSDEVDLSRTPEVRLSIYPKAEPWGYKNWKEAEGAVLDILLEPAEGTNLVFRSMSTTPLSFAGPFEADPDLGYGIVQYYLTVKYWDKGGDAHPAEIDSKQWDMPAWYYGFDDPNKKAGAKFSPFTVLDTVSPGRAWFNEINFSDENGNNANQFVEICFPGGYDMTGWRIYRYNKDGMQDLLAALGVTTGVPSTKAANGGDPNFAFYALTSPQRSVENADAFWSISPADCNGLNSYGFQLVRPSGIIEQQVVVQSKIGTGRYSHAHLGTNVVAQLEKIVGGTWEFVGADTNAAIKSSGVFQNAGAKPTDWNDVMDMTPGRINGDQTIPPEWFLPPGGTNVWLSLSTVGDFVWIVDGEDRVTMKTLVVPQGTPTNLVFETAPWYQLAALMRDVTNDVTSEAARSAGTARTNVWTYAFQEDSRNSATLDASAMPDENVLARGMLDQSDPYTPAVMKWLIGGEANGKPFKGDEISTNCFFQGLSVNSRREYLPLKERYWLDIDPTSDEWDLRGGMGDVSNLNAPTPTPPVAKAVYRNRPNIWPLPVTNRVVTVAMMISNKVDHALSYPPNRLQGLGGEKSDVVGARNWTSETFKVMMSLIKGSYSEESHDVSDSYWPMAMFVFNGGSFGAPDGPNPFAARIEVLDPMSTGSPAYSYGWWKYPGSTYGYKWDLSHGIYLRAPSMLNTTNTWDKTWEANDDE